MANDRYSDPHERAAGGVEFDDDLRGRATDFGSRLASEGPDALLEQIEQLLPESWRDQIRLHPLTAIAIGVGVGVFLGMKKGDDVLAAGSSLIAAAATANLNSVLSRMRETEE
jgi:LPS sulfotransferase NodH